MWTFYDALFINMYILLGLSYETVKIHYAPAFLTINNDEWLQISIAEADERWI